MANLDIIIRAQNLANAALRDVQGQLGGIQEQANVAQRGLGGLQSAVGTGLKVAAGIGVAAIAGLGAGLASAVAAGSDVQEMMGKFSIVFANTQEDVIAQLDSFGRAVGRNKYELREMAATFGDTLKPMGFAEEDAADLSVTLSKLAVDLGSFNNMDTDEALRRLQGTLVGSHENALAFGVVINENTLKAEMAANGWDELTGAQLEQAKVQARINLLMKGTTDAQGDAARTSDGWANQMRRLQSILQETQAEIGTKLLPVLTPLLTKFGDLAGQYMPAVIDGFQKLLDQVVFVIIALLNFDTAALPILGTLQNISTQIWEVIGPIVDVIGQFVSWKDVLMALGVVVASVVLPVLAGIVASALPVIAIAAALVAAVALVRNAWENDWGGIRTALTTWWNGTGKPIFDKLQMWLAEKLPGALSTLGDYWENTLLPAIRTVWSFIETNLLPLLGALVDVWLAAVGVQLALLAQIWEQVLKPALTALWSFISTNILPVLASMTGGVDGISTAFSTVIGWLREATTWLRNVASSIRNMPSLNLFGGGILGFANGTSFAPGGLALVGERGPELVSLPRGSRVDTAERTQRMMGGDTYYITQNISGADPIQTAHETMRALDYRRRRGQR